MSDAFYVTKNVVINHSANKFPPEWWVVDLRDEEHRDGKLVRARFIADEEEKAHEEARRLNTELAAS